MRIIWACIAALAATPLMADPTLECGEFGSQIEIGRCVSEAEERVENAVAFMYDQARRAAEELDEITGRDVAVPALEAGQEAWVAYRDAHCDYVGATFGGGSGTGIGISACRVEHGRTRVNELQALIP